MKKRVLSMLMTLALCLTLLPTPAWAAEDTPEGGAIVQEEQEEATPTISEQAAENGIAVQDGGGSTVSEQAGTNEDENGAEGGRQNTDTPDAGGAEDSKADAPESGEDENAGNNADAAVSAVQTMIDALPIVSELDGMTADELDAAYDDIQAAYDAYEALNAEQQAQINGADFEALLGWFNSRPRCWRTHSPASIPTVSAARTAVQRSTVIPITPAQHGRQPIPCPVLLAAII